MKDDIKNVHFGNCFHGYVYEVKLNKFKDLGKGSGPEVEGISLSG